MNLFCNALAGEDTHVSMPPGRVYYPASLRNAGGAGGPSGSTANCAAEGARERFDQTEKNSVRAYIFRVAL
jgi:hypothetical protein